MSVAPKNGTACLTFTLMVVAPIMESRLNECFALLAAFDDHAKGDQRALADFRYKYRMSMNDTAFMNPSG
jgi:hypothetical protein